MYSVDGSLLSRQYKLHISNFLEWKEHIYNHDFIVFEDNIGEYLSIDETTLSQGEIYTIVTNKSAKGRKGSLVAIIKGTKADNVIYALSKISMLKRKKVKEVTLDLAPTMKQIVKYSFPYAVHVSDRFHVQRLINEAVNDLRVSHRWQAIDQENAEIQLAKETGHTFKSHVFSNGDTRRQLLARSRYIVMKHYSKWTGEQKRRAEILFEQYPDIEQAYQISMELTNIYNQKINKNIAITKLAHWYNKVEKLNLKFFKSVVETMKNNYLTIVNYFDRRATNASAESFNAKIKAFRAQFRGVRDIPFFLFRLAKLFA